METDPNARFALKQRGSELMKFSVQEIEHQLRSGRNSSWEFKQVEFAEDQPTLPTLNDWANELSAFANAKGGKMLASVGDDGSIIGMTRAQITNLTSMLGDLSSDTIKPPLRVRSYNRMLSDGKLALVLEIPEGGTLHESPDGIFIRTGDSVRLMGKDEISRLALWRSQALFLRFDQQPVPETGFKTLNESLWKRLVPSNALNEPKAALKKLALLGYTENRVARATVTGVLLCTSNPEQWLSGARITAAHYLGEDSASAQIDSKEITGPLDQQIAAAIAFVTKNMQVAARKDPARTDLPDYSVTALFEALVNAVVHRNYSITERNIRLSMFSDRLEIQSPGTPPRNLTLDSISVRQSVRNETLVSNLARMPVEKIPGGEHTQYFTEKRGGGVSTICRETWALSGKYPEYRIINDSDVLLVIPAARHDPSPARIVVSVRSDGHPLPGADLLFLYPNSSWIQVTTDDEGEAWIDLHTTHLPMTVFASKHGHAAHLERNWMPSERPLEIALDDLPNGGSVISTESDVCFPLLKGLLNLMRDEFDRVNLYASNLAINAGMQQPIYIGLGENLKLNPSLTSDDLSC